MVKVKVISDKPNKRILRCSEGNRVWYRLWINPEDMMRIEPLLEGGDRIWMEELEMYYLFFYEIRNGRRVLGKDRVKKILDTIIRGIEMPGMLGLWLLCVLWGLWDNRGTSLSEERFWCGTKNGVPLRRGVKKLRY